MSLPPGSRLGPYEVLRQIGAGGMGVVYEGRDPRLGRPVAIKVLSPSFATDPERLHRFEQEARLAGALSHPNILTIHDVGSYGGSPYLVMELLEGQTLRDLLRGGALPVARALDLALQFARGLAAAHAKGLVHRDLKPANLFITRDGRLKILDFGLAKQVSHPGSASGGLPSDGTGSGLTLEGMALGTVGYMSPEQVSGRPADARSDLFTFGVVLYEMLSGRRAFDRDGTIEILSATLKEDPPELVGPTGAIPPPLQRLVSRCLEKAPDRRFPSTEALVHDLESLLDQPTSATRAAWATPLQVFLGPKPWAQALAALVLVVTGGGTLLIKDWPRPATAPAPVAPSLVALPARVIGTEEAAFLADAIPDSLSTLLASVDGLDMKLPPTTVQVESVKGDLARIAAAYRVDQVLVTTVSAEGERLVLDVKLVEVATRKVRWAGQFEGRRGTYNLLLRQAADALAQVLRPGARLAANQGPRADSEPDLVLKEGRHYAARYVAYNQQADFDRASDAYGRVLKAEPASAEAMGEWAYLWIYRSWQGGGEFASSAAEAERLARRALALDSRIGSAWSALAQAEGARRPSSLERRLTYAIRAANPKGIRPDSGGAIGGTLGGPILMAATGRLAFEMKPLEPLWGGMGAYGLTWQDRPEEALRLLERVLAVEPGFRFGLVAKAQALVKLGRLAESEALLERCAIQEQDLTLDAELWRQVRFDLAIAQGDRATANRYADRAARLWLGPDASPIDVNAICTMPPGLVKLGRTEEALRMLEIGMDQLPIAEGYLWVLDHPDLAPLRGNPRYQRLQARGRQDLALSMKAFQAAWDRGELPAGFQSALAELRALQERTP